MDIDVSAVLRRAVNDRDYRPISDYAFVGDCHGAALVASDGSVDWCCLKRFDAEPVFSRLLGRQRGGFFQIAPTVENQVKRGYTYATNILETTFETDQGIVRVIDFMPVRLESGAAPDDYTALAARHWLVRIVDGVSGCVPIQALYRPLPGFAETFPKLKVRGNALSAAGCPPLTSSTDFLVEKGIAISHFEISAG